MASNKVRIASLARSLYGETVTLIDGKRQITPCCLRDGPVGECKLISLSRMPSLTTESTSTVRVPRTSVNMATPPQVPPWATPRFPSVGCQVQPGASYGDKSCTCCPELHGVKRNVWAAVAHVSVMRAIVFEVSCTAVFLWEQDSSAFVSQDTSTVTARLFGHSRRIYCQHLRKDATQIFLQPCPPFTLPRWAAKSTPTGVAGSGEMCLSSVFVVLRTIYDPLLQAWDDSGQL